VAGGWEIMAIRKESMASIRYQTDAGGVRLVTPDAGKDKTSATGIYYFQKWSLQIRRDCIV